MDTNLHIMTTGEYVLKPIVPGQYHPGALCVTYSKWGVSNIGTIQPGFHRAYMRLADIKPRPMATAPLNTKLLLKSRFGCWLIGSVKDSTRAHYSAWAPLPKVAADVDRALASPRELPPRVEAAVQLFEALANDSLEPNALRRVSSVRTLMLDALQRAQGSEMTMSQLLELIRKKDESPLETLRALMDVLPYLTGGYGVYEMTFRDIHNNLLTVTRTPGKLHFQDADGVELDENQVYLVLVRQDPKTLPVA